MSFETILLLIIIAILIFSLYKASQKIKDQEAMNNHLQNLLELQGKAGEGVQDVG